VDAGVGHRGPRGGLPALRRAGSRPAHYDPESPKLGAIYESASPAAELLSERGALPYRHVPDACDYWSELSEDRASTGRVLVHIAAQLAVRDGATVIAGIRDGQQARARELGARHVVVTDSPEAVAEIRAIAPAGVDRIAEVEFTSHIDLDAGVIAIGGVIASYYSARERPEFPYMTLGFADTTLRLLGSDDFPPAVKLQAAQELTAALLDGSLRSTIAVRLPLAEIARAHELVEQGAGGRVVIEIA
jgi:Zinc-binding dehydrogenase